MEKAFFLPKRALAVAAGYSLFSES